MVVLSDRDIKEYLAKKKIIIEPLNDPESQIQPAWIDLRLGNKFRIFKPNSAALIDPKKRIDDYTEVVEAKEDKPFIIHPGEFVLGCVKEYIKISEDLMGVVDGRSSLGRLGIIVHSTAAGINPGWEGIFTLEITNVGKMPIALYPGMKICKLVLHKLSSPAERPYYMRKEAKYQKQKGLEESKIFEEFTK